MKDSKVPCLSRKDVAERYRVNVSTVWRWVDAGVFPKPIRISGRVVRWKLSQLEEFERKNEQIS